MKQKITALLLVMALVSTFAASAFATEATGVSTETTSTTAEESTESSTATETEAPDAVTDDTAADSAEEILNQAPVIEVGEASPDMVMFVDLADMVKKNSPAYKALRANASAIDDAEDQVDTMKTMLARVESALAALDSNPDLTPEEKAEQKAQLQSQKTQLQSGISGLSSMANQDTSQMDGTANQLILGSESIYIALVGLEIQETALVRQLAALDRTIAELKVRHEWGQVSQLQLMEAENGRATLVSGLTTLRMNMTNLRMQLENMLGQDITGTIEVGTLPRVTAEQLSAIDLEKDLKMVLRRNPDVQAAENKEDSLFGSGMTGDLLDSMSSAADYGIESAKLQAEMKFRSLYGELMDCRQVLTNAKSSLEVEQLAYQAEELKYNQGTISKNAFLAAADELQTAKEAVLTAENNLFSTYNEYNWAVKHGIFM